MKIQRNKIYLCKEGNIISIISSGTKLNTTTKMSDKSLMVPMNIVERFALSITKKPKKSFRKVGITDGDDLITNEGAKILISWLLNKHADEFKKEVVDVMIKDQERETKK